MTDTVTIPPAIEKGGPFDEMESPVRLTNAQCGWLWALLRNPAATYGASSEAEEAYADIALLIATATQTAIEAHLVAKR